MEKYRGNTELKKTFKGRAILPGNIEGEALVTHRGFNTYASFFTSIHVPSNKAPFADSGNQDNYGKNLTGKIICLPKTIGSASGGFHLPVLQNPVPLFISVLHDLPDLFITYVPVPSLFLQVVRNGSKGFWFFIQDEFSVHIL